MNTADLATLGAPTGPFPITETRLGQKPVVIGQADDTKTGRLGLGEIAANWTLSKKGRTATRIDDYTISLFYSDGKLRCLLTLEAIPVPDIAGVGDVLVDPAGGVK